MLLFRPPALPRVRSPLPRLARRAGLALATAALALVLTSGGPFPAEAAPARVAADGVCLNFRAAAGLRGEKVDCIADGSALATLDGETATVDGLAWQRVRLPGGATGWVAAIYLAYPASPAPTPAATLAARSPGRPFAVPPPGGITIGIAGTTSIDALIAAQPFPVAAMAVRDPTTQGYMSYVASTPRATQSLNDATLQSDSVVIVTRAAAPAGSEGAPTIAAAGLATSGTLRALPTPPPGGMTQGAAGTSDLAALLAAQPFAVELVMALDVPSQRWLMHILGAPEAANTLDARMLRPETIVTVRRSATLPDPTRETPPPPAAAVTVGTEVATITYYFCTPGTRGIGDGGGFCGGTASGTTVHPGTASCGRGLMGQRFRIVGDATVRTYVCEDTGGGVGATHRDLWFATSDEGYDWWQQTAPGGTARIEVVR